jgi:hypothetical protein
MNYFDTLFAKNLAGGGGGGGGGTAMYRHDVWLTDFSTAQLNFSIVTADATPYTSLSDIADVLYSNGFTGSNQLACIGCYKNDVSTYTLVCRINSGDGVSLGYAGMQNSFTPSYAGGTISFTPKRFYDVVTALQ